MLKELLRAERASKRAKVGDARKAHDQEYLFPTPYDLCPCGILYNTVTQSAQHKDCLKELTVAYSV